MAEYKVIDADQLESDLTIVADAIRAKAGITEKLEFPLGMKSAVESIQSGGGSDNPIVNVNVRTFRSNAVSTGGYFNADGSYIEFAYGYDGINVEALYGLVFLTNDVEDGNYISYQILNLWFKCAMFTNEIDSPYLITGGEIAEEELPDL